MQVNIKIDSEVVKKIYPMFEKWAHGLAWQRELFKAIHTAITDINEAEMRKQKENQINPWFKENIK
jgi:hypothetical protein